MNIKNIELEFCEHIRTLENFAVKENYKKIDELACLIKSCLENGNKLLLCGNGGSAADCQHLAAEFVGRFKKERHGLPAIALTVDTSIITAIGNDYGYEKIFERQIEAIATNGDILIGISTSGNSKNVLRAVEYARSKDIYSFGFLGCDGGKLKGLCNDCIVVEEENTARVQEVHILVGHILCKLVEDLVG